MSTSWAGASENWSMPSSVSAVTITQPNTTPMTSPRSGPSRAMITDSQRTIERTCRRVMPTARSSPSSRVRSMIDSAERVGDAEQRDDDREEQQHVDQVQELVRLDAACDSLNSVAVLELRSPDTASIDGLQRGFVFAADSAPAVFT